MDPVNLNFWQRHSGKLWVLGVVVGGVVLGLVLANALKGSDTVKPKPFNSTRAKILRNEQILRERAKKEEEELPVQTRLPPASDAAGNGTSQRSASPDGTAVLSPGATAAFSALENELSAQIGVAIAPLGPGEPQQIGSSLETGHAWSSLKVPIVATVLREQGSLTESQMSQASAAITASDNEAAAALFSSLGSSASSAVESTLAASGYPTQVATAAPPSGAVSSWGQTEWPLVSSVGFYRALACEDLGISEADTAYVIGLMESVISEQQWGLGQAGIDGRVAIKAGWGPDGSSSGPYLVRQAGILRSTSGNSGVVVTIAAQDSSGSFEAGVQDLDAVADWVRDNVNLDAGSC
jgi:hypothetical protein